MHEGEFSHPNQMIQEAEASLKEYRTTNVIGEAKEINTT
jgi:hypothetical protein